VAPGSVPPLEGEVRVWIARLDLGAEAVDRLGRLLSDDERALAERFCFRHDANRFVVSRAVLRTLLGACLGVEPYLVGFTYGPHGKPALAAPFDRSGVQFNASHSAGLGLYAVTEKRRVGVDIERLRPLPDLEAIAERTFSPHERQALHRLPHTERHQGFFNCWTRKEAYIKATGDGLFHPLNRFTVSLAPRVPARLERVEGDPAEAERWTMEALAPDPGCAAAIAIEGRPSRLSCFRWQAYAE
jgi:4'-phosphopantetheinyl transferase